MLHYNIILTIYALIIKVAALWNPKAKQWSDGRKAIFRRMSEAISPSDRIVWVHVASLGEFEQGRPLIEKIREEHPEYKILLTFFSPSGYEVRKDYKGADYIFYMPLDTTSSARKFLEIAHPEIAIFVKYEFWLNTLFQLKKLNIKSYIVSAIFRERSIFFRWYGGYWRRALKTFNTIFVQNTESKELLKGIGFTNVEIAGDTRFDRVAQIALSAKPNAIVEKFKGDKRLMIAGSTWSPDEELIYNVVTQNSDIKFVIAPHEIGEERVGELLHRLGSRAIRYTKVDNNTPLGSIQVMILDTMGQLSSIYRYADWAYIGGGFGVGIHNTLEAATFGLPIAFGPNYHKFKEAKDMVELGACCPIQNSEELTRWFEELRDNNERHLSTRQLSKSYATQNQGASNIILSNIFTA